MNSSNKPKVELDDVDRTLITALQQDGRRGYGDLGKLVNLTAGGARKRVMRLQEHGALQVVGVTDPLRLGYQAMSMIGVVATGDVERIANELSKNNSFVYVVLTAGQFDLMVEALATDQEEMFEIINQSIRKHPQVIRAEVFTYYSIHTHRFGWGA